MNQKNSEYKESFDSLRISTKIHQFRPTVGRPLPTRKCNFIIFGPNMTILEKIYSDQSQNQYFLKVFKSGSE